jgi:SAM-dependent methyltransferase
MAFDVAASAYDRFMGRYSIPLASEFADFAGVRGGGRVLDVGCGPGALTGELVARVGADAVSAVDPSEGFAAAARTRFPDVDVRVAAAEALPFEDGRFDAALAQLVVHFMADPVAGLGEMARVTRPGGVVAACVWDLAGGRSPLSLFWEAARELDPDVEGESAYAGARDGHLVELLNGAGIGEVEGGVVAVDVEHESFEEWWGPFTLGVGPSGAYAAGLDPEARARLRDLCRQKLPEPPFVVTGRAWAARGVARPDGSRPRG